MQEPEKKEELGLAILQLLILLISTAYLSKNKVHFSEASSTFNFRKIPVPSKNKKARFHF